MYVYIVATRQLTLLPTVDVAQEEDPAYVRGKNRKYEGIYIYIRRGDDIIYMCYIPIYDRRERC